jgi:predicted SAM-dependent methyltransferase
LTAGSAGSWVAQAGRRVPPLRWLVRFGSRLRRWPRDVRHGLRDRRLLETLQHRTDLRINVGSSSSALDGWVNVDLLPDPEGRCLVMDAAKPWPLTPGSTAFVNSEHFIEHLSDEEARAYLREAYSVLRPGGVIRTSTPDLQGISQSMLQRDRRDLEIHRSHGYTAATHGEMVNNYVYGSGHRRLYDEQTLVLLLAEAGFVEPRRCSYGESEHEALKGIDRHDPEGLEHFVLCVEAVKPELA